MTTEPIISVRDLKKTYRRGFFGNSVPALKNATFDVHRGEIFGLIGPNGAGKTTLIKILLGIIRKSGGEARLLGLHEADRRARQRIGYLPEGHRLPRHLTGNTALEFYGGLSGLPLGEIRRRRGKLLDSVGLSKWGATPVAEYSKGMQQRLGLAQAMLHDPELLMLDEPTDGIDPVGRAELRTVLKDMKDQGHTIFLNTHLLHEVELICDRVAVLIRGQVQLVDRVSVITQAGGETEVTLNLRGRQEVIMEVLRDYRTTGFEKQKTDEFSVGVVVDTQDAIDKVIDALRGRSISICTLTRRKLSLEDVFVQLVRGQGRAAG